MIVCFSWSSLLWGLFVAVVVVVVVCGWCELWWGVGGGDSGAVDVDTISEKIVFII